MRILELLGTGAIGTDEGNSASNVVLELSNQFVGLGHKVVLADPKTPRKRSGVAPGVELLEVDVPPAVDIGRPDHWQHGKIAGLGRIVLNPEQYRVATEIIRHYKYFRSVASRITVSDFDIIHSHHGKLSLLLNKLFRRPYVYTSHWPFPPSQMDLDARIERIIVNGAQLAVGLGVYLKEFAPKANVQIIPHGIDLDKWPILHQKASRRTLGIAQRDFVLLFVGGIRKIKGPDVLVEAVRMLAPELKNLKLYLIGALGTGTSIDSFARTLIDQSKGLPINFVGFLNNLSPDFQNYLAAADLFVQPSLVEAQSLAALEALAMGKPVIASKVGGLAEMIKEDVGCHFRSGDAQDLASKIRDLYEHRSKLEAMRNNCRKYVENQYTWKVVAQRYISAFETCLRT